MGLKVRANYQIATLSSCLFIFNTFLLFTFDIEKYIQRKKLLTQDFLFFWDYWNLFLFF